MNSKLLLPLLGFTLLCISQSQAQTIKTIELDFKDKATPSTPVTGISKGDYYRIKITNINQNLYKVSLSVADSTLSKPQQTPTFGNFDLDALSKLALGISPSATSVTVQESFQNFNSILGNLKSKTDYTNAIVAANQSIIAQMNKEKVGLQTAKSKLEALATRIDILKMDVYKHRLKALKNDNPSGIFDFDMALTEVEAIRTNLSTLQQKANSDKSTYESFSETNKVAIGAVPDLTNNDKTIKEAYEKLSTTVSEALASVSADKAQELLSPLVFIDNNKKNEYLSMPIQFAAEQSRVQVTITPRDEKYTLQPYSTSIIFPLNVKKYTVVGVSFFGSTLHDEVYSSVKEKASPTDTTSIFRYKQENWDKGEIGVTAMLRYGQKWAKNNDFGTHASLGAGVSISHKVKPRILFGGGLTWGQKHMLAIDLGGIIGYVDRKSNVIELTQSYLEKPESAVVSKLSFGGFLSLGYTYQF